jgi:hypothetical protein
MTDYNKFLKEGKETELNFALSLSRHSGIALDRIKFATRDEDIYEHWDLSYIGIKIDVKGQRKLYRQDPAPNQEYHWIEFRNVNGDTGSLYGSADLFAFELDLSYLCIQRTILQKFIEDKCREKKQMLNREPYTIFRRAGRKDILTLAKSLDLAQISDFIIKKI